MPDSEISSQEQNSLLNPEALNDVLAMGRMMASALLRVEERLNACAAEQETIKQNQKNMQRTLETLVSALRGQMRAPPPSQVSGSQVIVEVGPLEHPPESPNPDLGTEIARSDTSGRGRKRKFEDDDPGMTSAESIGTSDGTHECPVQPTSEDHPPHHPDPNPGVEIDSERSVFSGRRRKWKLEEDTPEITSWSIGTSSRMQKRASQSPPPIQTLSEAVQDTNETNINVREVPGDDESADERDELEDDAHLADADPDVEEKMIRRSSKPNVRVIALDLSPGLIFTNDKRCTACINRGLTECAVLKDPYTKLEEYVDLVLMRATQKARPRDSACFACEENHATFCHFPITREKLGPGFTRTHIAGPFPVPVSAPDRRKKGSTGVPRPHKKPRTLSPDSLFSVE